MKSKLRWIVGLFVTAIVAVVLSVPAYAHEDPAKCNSGRGNGSETTPADDCDPGNSGGVNNGGD